jgi:hypothetical protein
VILQTLARFLRNHLKQILFINVTQESLRNSKSFLIPNVCSASPSDEIFSRFKLFSHIVSETKEEKNAESLIFSFLPFRCISADKRGNCPATCLPSEHDQEKK